MTGRMSIKESQMALELCFSILPHFDSKIASFSRIQVIQNLKRSQKKAVEAQKLS